MCVHLRHLRIAPACRIPDQIARLFAELRGGSGLPTYEYLCDSCGNRYEKRESFDAPARQKCPNCGKRANRVLQAPPIVFKGSGFYKTDSRGTSSASTDSAAPSKPVETKTESEPAKPAASSDSSSTTTEAAAAG
jgi:putative FmdB family regulatory protein